jgi:hypothetical protein
MLYGTALMTDDDETRKQLKQICEVLLRLEAQNIAWIDEMRPVFRISTSRWQKSGGLAIALLFMLVLLLEIIILGRLYGFL